MKKPKVIEGFDCVASKHKAQAEIYEATKHMGAEEKIAYFKRESTKGHLGAFWKRLETKQTGHKAKVAA